MSIDLSLVSKYRTQLMGVAAVFIILCHTSLSFGGIVQSLYSIYVSQLMQCGVDIFLLLSGLGCYFSFAKNPSVKFFYKKRLIRIAVPYIIFLIIYFVIDCLILHNSIESFFMKHSVVTFFSNGVLATWFVAAILLLYLFFPIIYKIINKNEAVFLICIAVNVVLVLLPFWKILPKPLPVIREIFLCRIPVFCVGTWIGKRVFEKRCIFTKKGINIYLLVILIISLIAFSVYAISPKTFDKRTITRLLFLPLSFSLVLLLSKLFQKLNIENRKSNKVLLLLGTISFELYLLFERVLAIVTQSMSTLKIFSDSSQTVTQAIFNIIAIGCTVLFAYLLYRISKKIISFLI